MMISQPTQADRVITLAIDCRAPRRKVYETWTQPEWLKKWFMADQGHICNLAEVDLRVDGRFRISMGASGSPPTAEQTTFTGAYQAIAADEALVYTWSGGEGDHVTLVTTLFRDRDKGSRVDFTHGVFATQAARDKHAAGWIACPEQFGQVLGE